MDVCPENCLQLVPLQQFTFSDSTVERLEAERSIRLVDLQHVEPADLSQTAGSVMVKDETICIRCGLCAERCPVHTITMEAYEAFDEDPELVQIETLAMHA